MKIVTVSQMKKIEQETDAAGISYAQMMESAGRGVAEAIEDWLDVRGRSVLILVGPGNNGGDGLVAGRYLAQAGAEVAFYLLKPRSDDDINYSRAIEMGLSTTLAADDHDLQLLSTVVAQADVVVDALLGTGADRAIGGMLKAMMECCSRVVGESRWHRQTAGPASPLRPSPLGCLPLIVAVDCPSGLNCDTGALDSAALSADLTVTFAHPKIGHFLFPGASAVGELLVADIGVPDGLPALQPVALEMVTADWVRTMLPTRPIDAHKGTFGKVMIAAGSINYIGAASLAGEAAYRSGAGLVTMAVPGAILSSLAARLTEATYLVLPHSMGSITAGATRILLDGIGSYNALLVGPGLGQEENTRLFLKGILSEQRSAARARIGFIHEPRAASFEAGSQLLPSLVVDADGLNLLAGMDRWPTLLPSHSILTPHPGEMARLLACERQEIMKDRVGTARRAAEQWQQVVVLKGAFTVVASPEGQVSLIPVASSALATAGSGDVLSGVIVALLGMGLDPYLAAVAGAFIHAVAGLRAAEEIGSTGVMAGDLPRFIPTVLEELATR